MLSPTPIAQDEKEILKEYFEMNVISASGGKKLTAEEKKHASGKAIMKMIEPLMGKAEASFCEGGVLTKLADKKTKKMHIDVFTGAFFPELAKYIAHNHPAAKKKGTTAEDLRQLYLTNVRIELTNDNKDEQKDSAVVSRLTDSSKYTGAHKGRFDEDGKGKGGSGRRDEGSNSGYVGNYKGEGSFKE